MKLTVRMVVLFQSDLGPIDFLVISFSTNVSITQPSRSNRSFRFVMYD